MSYRHWTCEAAHCAWLRPARAWFCTCREARLRARCHVRAVGARPDSRRRHIHDTYRCVARRARAGVVRGATGARERQMDEKRSRDRPLLARGRRSRPARSGRRPSTARLPDRAPSPARHVPGGDPACGDVHASRGCRGRRSSDALRGAPREPSRARGRPLRRTCPWRRHSRSAIT